jgi:hypothetical protein
LGELILDTTYLLPALGVGTKPEGFEGRFPKLLGIHRVRYNPISLVEAKWIVLRAARKRAAERGRLLERYRFGLRVLLADERVKQTTVTSEAVELVADRLLVDNVTKDYFDRLIYGMTGLVVGLSAANGFTTFTHGIFLKSFSFSV